MFVDPHSKAFFYCYIYFLIVLIFSAGTLIGVTILVKAVSVVNKKHDHPSKHKRISDADSYESRYIQ